MHIPTNVVNSHPAHGEVYSNTTLCDKVCQWLATGRWFSPCTPVSSTNKTDSDGIAEISKIYKYVLAYYSFSFFPHRIFCNTIILCRNQNGKMDGRKILQDRRVQMDSHKWLLWNCVKHICILIYHLTLSPA